MKAPEYTEEQLAFFATFAEKRAPFAAAQCNNGERCWVKHGPPCLHFYGRLRCRGCDGTVAKRIGGGNFRYAR